MTIYILEYEGIVEVREARIIENNRLHLIKK